MTTIVPPLPNPRPKTAVVQSPKPWMVNIAISDPEDARKLRQLSQALDKKPGRVVADAITEWLASLDIDQITQEALPLEQAS